MEDEDKIKKVLREIVDVFAKYEYDNPIEVLAILCQSISTLCKSTFENSSDCIRITAKILKDEADQLDLEDLTKS